MAVTEISADAIDITIPLRAEHAATLRVIVASLGADAGFTVDEIDDLKLAVSEVFTLLADDAAHVGATRAHGRILATDDSVELSLHRGVDGDELELDLLASTILSSVVDSHQIHGGSVTMHKRRHES